MCAVSKCCQSIKDKVLGINAFWHAENRIRAAHRKMCDSPRFPSFFAADAVLPESSLFGKAVFVWYAFFIRKQYVRNYYLSSSEALPQTKNSYSELPIGYKNKVTANMRNCRFSCPELRDCLWRYFINGGAVSINWQTQNIKYWGWMRIWNFGILIPSARRTSENVR